MLIRRHPGLQLALNVRNRRPLTCRLSEGKPDSLCSLRAFPQTFRRPSLVLNRDALAANLFVCTDFLTIPFGLATMKLNRPGLILCGVYAAFSLLLIWFGYSTADVKSRVFLEKVAVLPAILLIGVLGLEKTVMLHPWMYTIPTFFVLSLVLMYLVGWALSSIRRMLGKRDRSGHN